MTKCFYHPDRDAVNTCSQCGQPVCNVCNYLIGSHPVCRNCWDNRQLAIQEEATGEKTVRPKRRLTLPNKIAAGLIFVILGIFGTWAVCVHTQPSQAPLNVLFIGNSYTDANSLPTIFQEIAVSAGYARPVVKSSTPGGYTFQEHLASSATCSMISSQHWDVVIMQEQSEVPAAAQTMPEVKKSFLDGFDGLYNLVKESNPEARVILFETWARNSDLWSNGKADPVWEGKNPSDMLQRLKAGYEEASQSVTSRGDPPVEIARVGELWGINYNSASGIRLHDSDGSHPNFAGSYLAALDIYSTVYGTVPVGLNYHGTLRKDQADYLENLLIRNFPDVQEQ